MFQFGTFPTYDYVFIIRYTYLLMCRFPHSEIYGCNGYLLLTVAYRSLSRPSSAPDAKAFPLCSFLLQLLSCVSSHTLDPYFDCMSFANRLFYSIVVHPYLFEKTFQSLSQIFIFLILSVFTLPWELFFLIFRVLDLLFLLFDFQRTLPFGLVGSSGFEPPTLRLSGARSNHLSYEPLHPV